MKRAPFPASSVAGTASGLARPLRARRPALAQSPLCAKYKGPVPSRKFPSSFHLSRAPFGRLVAPCVGLRLSLGRPSPIVAPRPCLKHVGHRLGRDRWPLKPTHSHIVFGMNGRSAPFIHCPMTPQPRCSSAQPKRRMSQSGVS